MVGLRRRVEVEGGVTWGSIGMSWGWVWESEFDGGGGWEERKLRGRLEPGTSVVNGSLFDNICRGRWEGGKREDRGFLGAKLGFCCRRRLGRRRKRERVERKRKKGLRDISPVSHTVGPTIPPTKPH